LPETNTADIAVQKAKPRTETAVQEAKPKIKIIGQKPSSKIDTQPRIQSKEIQNNFNQSERPI